MVTSLPAQAMQRAALPVLLRLLANPSTRPHVPAVLARLIEGSEPLQKAAADADTVRLLAGLLAADAAPPPASAAAAAASPATKAGAGAPAAAAEAGSSAAAAAGLASTSAVAALREGCLRALGSLCLNRDDSRKQLLEAKVRRVKRGAAEVRVEECTRPAVVGWAVPLGDWGGVPCTATFHTRVPRAACPARCCGISYVAWRTPVTACGRRRRCVCGRSAAACGHCAAGEHRIRLRLVVFALQFAGRGGGYPQTCPPLVTRHSLICCMAARCAQLRTPLQPAGRRWRAGAGAGGAAGRRQRGRAGEDGVFGGSDMWIATRRISEACYRERLHGYPDHTALAATSASTAQLLLSTASPLHCPATAALHFNALR